MQINYSSVLLSSIHMGNDTKVEKKRNLMKKSTPSIPMNSIHMGSGTEVRKKCNLAMKCKKSE